MKKLIETYEPKSKDKEKTETERKLTAWIEAVKKNSKK